MTDNRFGTMCVIRGHGDSEEWHGNETIQARLQGTGDPTPTRDAQAWRRRPLGRPGSLDSKQRARLSKLVVQGAVVNGFATEMWTLARVAKLIEREFGHSF